MRDTRSALRRSPAGAALRALAFLSRLPVPATMFDPARKLAGDAYAFPLAGLIVALPAAILVGLSPALGLEPLGAAALATATLVLVTGGLHEDGLADTADGLGGHMDKARALDVMKDSRIGAYGTLAIALSLLVRVGLMAELTGFAPWAAGLALLGVAALSRGAMTWLWSSLPAAIPGGVADAQGRPNEQAGRFAPGMGALALALFGAPLAGWGVGLALVLAAATAFAFRRAIERRLGGRTGDTLGALQQLVEIAALAGLAMAAG